jgi:methyl acetate hydrolase
MKRLILLSALAVVAAGVSQASQPSSNDLDTLLRRALEEKRVPAVVAMVADSKGVLYEQATGVSKDAIFPIASMTKPITSVAVMQLVEAGRVKLDAAAATYVSELGAVRVVDGAALRPAKSPVTVRQLLTHTAGFGYEFLDREVLDLVAKKQLPTAFAGDDGFLKAPLLFDPGTRWHYGINTDWLGRLVERVSGQSLDVYFRQKIFDPLGMSETFFVVPPEKQSRVVPTYQRNEDGTLVERPRQTTKVEFFSGGGGLYSTASDYVRFVRALLAGGQLGQRRILSAESVATMGSNHIGELTVVPLPSLMPQLVTDRAVLPGSLDKFGLGFALNTQRVDGGRGRNTLSWAGVFNTFFWIDREKQVGAVLLSNMLPFLDPGPKTLIEEFDRAVYAWRAR